MPAELRDYQVAAVDAVFRELADHRSTLLVMPTGCGKTVVFAEAARRWRAQGLGRVLVIAHREELIDQACDKIQKFAGLQTEIEMAERRAASSLFARDVVVASVQTLQHIKRREAFDPRAFGLVVIDEAHHAPAKTYRDIIGYFESAKVLGVTATPDRGDGVAMGEVFETVAFVYEIRDAIDEGHLVPIRQKAVQVEDLDLSKVRVTAGDLNEGDLEAVLTEEKTLHGVATGCIELAGNRPTIVFCATVAHAHAQADVLRRHAGSTAAIALDGTAERDVRKGVIADFLAGRFQYLANCALFTEGFDAPPVSCVAVVRPTKSRAFYAQMIGRGTRQSPETGKKDLLVLDFEGNAGKHSLVTVADILGGKEAPEVLAKAKELAAQMDLPIHAVIDEARSQIADAARRRVIAKARYQAVDINPFQILGAVVRPNWMSGQAITEVQANYLAKHKIDAEKLALDKNSASALIGQIIGRQREGLCTYKQAALLTKFGLSPDVSFDRAREQIDAIKANGWRLPPELRGEQQLGGNP